MPAPQRHAWPARHSNTFSDLQAVQSILIERNTLTGTRGTYQ